MTTNQLKQRMKSEQWDKHKVNSCTPNTNRPITNARGDYVLSHVNMIVVPQNKIVALQRVIVVLSERDCGASEHDSADSEHDCGASEA